VLLLLLLLLLLSRQRTDCRRFWPTKLFLRKKTFTYHVAEFTLFGAAAIAVIPAAFSSMASKAAESSHLQRSK
jgi:hypothetical protein